MYALCIRSTHEHGSAPDTPNHVNRWTWRRLIHVSNEYVSNRFIFIYKCARTWWCENWVENIPCILTFDSMNNLKTQRPFRVFIEFWSSQFPMHVRFNGCEIIPMEVIFFLLHRGICCWFSDLNSNLLMEDNRLGRESASSKNQRPKGEKLARNRIAMHAKGSIILIDLESYCAFSIWVRCDYSAFTHIRLNSIPCCKGQIEILVHIDLSCFWDIRKYLRREKTHILIASL